MVFCSCCLGRCDKNPVVDFPCGGIIFLMHILISLGYSAILQIFTKYNLHGFKVGHIADELCVYGRSHLIPICKIARIMLYPDKLFFCLVIDVNASHFCTLIRIIAMEERMLKCTTFWSPLDSLKTPSFHLPQETLEFGLLEKRRHHFGHKIIPSDNRERCAILTPLNITSCFVTFQSSHEQLGKCFPAISGCITVVSFFINHGGQLLSLVCFMYQPIFFRGTN
mmetsp:Transcript_36296/g.48640  ORF Transcript_36296/g.48640 Transcript_36296/m.48640 type:complete len:224 (+) Transcript_36296:814-1485(+)